MLTARLPDELPIGTPRYRVEVLLLGSSSLIQSSVPGDTGRWRALLRAPRLEALVRRSEDAAIVDHYVRSQGRPDRGWVRAATVTTSCLAPAALAQRPDRWGPRWRPGALVALIPSQEGVAAWTHDPSVDASPWQHVACLGAGEAVALAAHAGTLHAVIAQAGRARHWFSRDAVSWQAGQFLGQTNGTPALTILGDRLVVALPQGEEVQIVIGQPRTGWTPQHRVASLSDSPALVSAAPRQAWLALPQPDTGVSWWRGSATASSWTPMPDALPALAGHAQVRSVALSVTSLSGGWDASRLGLGALNLGGTRQAFSGPGGWVQALVAEDDGLFLWHREQPRARAASARWVRAAALRVPSVGPVLRAQAPSHKVAQISGEHDTQPGGNSTGSTLSSSHSTSGVRGTDLGVRVEVGDQSVMLFGDTHWQRKRWATRDALALIHDPDGAAPRFEFHGGPLRFRGHGTTMTEYDVPLDGFTHAGQWYVFTSSNHFARHQVMGRSLLARADDRPSAITGRTRRPFRFTTLAQLSDLSFINVSAQRLPAELPHLPFPDASQGLIGLWGSGSYRADDLRFAVLDPSADLTSPRLAYLSGVHRGVPSWSVAETDAVPLVRGAFGEVSVRWVAALGAYALLSMSDPEDAAGGAVVLRLSTLPWGPWSERLVLFDWIAEGLSFDDPSRRFIRAFHDDDPVGDAIFAAQAGRPGGAYAPYLYDSRPHADGVALRYTLSTWNPYQVVLMEHHLSAADLTLLGVTPG
ncbi:hypothetical protein C1706_08675 [Propioniciclava flava]|uniref:DUF4185 domain-containing protein n=1 Tax=Propioniciclava flava TaxID=2072026 RepID=A0A4Q2EJG2_9ACTN|nr:hypothetical protein C1706_08675 [Propioniciclava flava]